MTFLEQFWYFNKFNFVVVVASNDEGRMEDYGAVQNELMVTSRHCWVDVIYVI